MSRWSRVIIVIFSFILAVLSLITLLMFLSETIMSAMVAFFLRLQKIGSWRVLIILSAIVLLVTSVISLLLAVMSGRLRRARVRESTLGSVDIGVDAIESIALNAAKGSQSGVRSAKARVAPFKGDKLAVTMIVSCYSDVELPTMMSRVQERVKKDIERYTGIEVGEVHVRVSRVDAITARIDH
ncbi:MAG: alkaline shock response membrane anchor protein AmaP [Clostridiales bacterium]|nr:alkaline shock response membrane anchor protein AmaP [Clostridiales bacterium]MDD7432521.1 alkaline shock response membrane anchor protein AmaP [Clostridiales bacterium]MDY3061428.1 alkaline shock response membrane anchor protein AmaP [Eubacteriales bacterium]